MMESDNSAWTYHQTFFFFPPKPEHLRFGVKKKKHCWYQQLLLTNVRFPMSFFTCSEQCDSMKMELMFSFRKHLKHKCENDKMNVMDVLLFSDLYNRIWGYMRQFAVI